MIWYFAYGSNLWVDQMVARVGPSFHVAIAPRIVRLLGHRLAFNMRGQDGQFYANLEAPGKHVFGVVYSCSADVLEKLDLFESGYHRERLIVLDGDGTAVEAYAYISNPENAGAAGIPCDEYLQRILKGGCQHGLPDSYLRDIAELAQKRP